MKEKQESESRKLVHKTDKVSYLLNTKPTYHRYLKGEQISKKKNRLIKQTLREEGIQLGNEQVEAGGFIRNTKVDYIQHKRIYEIRLSKQ